MTKNSRYPIFAVAAMAIAVGLLLLRTGGGIPLIVFGVILLLTVWLEPRYRRSECGPADAVWVQTSERFFDEESGELLEVWFDPKSGERRYVPVADEASSQRP